MEKELQMAKAMYHLATIADQLAEASDKVEKDRYAKGSADAYRYMKTEIEMEANYLGITIKQTVGNASAELYRRVRALRDAYMGLIDTYNNRLRDGLLYSKAETDKAFVVIQSVLNDIYYQETGNEL